MPTGGKRVAVMFWAGPQALQRSECLKDDVYYPFTILNVANAGILITCFLPSCFQNYICECFNFTCCDFKISINKNRVNLQGINFSQ
jgi:hypothetical protein